MLLLLLLTALLLLAAFIDRGSLHNDAVYC